MRKIYFFLFLLTLVICFTTAYPQKYAASQMMTTENGVFCKVAYIEATTPSKQAEFVADNLEIIWHKPEPYAIGQEVYYSKLIDKSLVHWYLNDQRVAQYAHTNSAVWEFPTTSDFPSVYANKSGSMYVVADGTNLSVLDPVTGEEIWQKTFDASISYAAAFPDGTGFYCSVGEYPDPYMVYAFLKTSQTPLWSLPAESSVVGISVSEDHSQLLVCLAQPAQKAMVVDPANGAVKQELYYYNNSPSQAPAFSANGEYLALADFSGKGTLYKRINGKYEEQWKTNLLPAGSNSCWGSGQAISADGSTIAFGTLDFTSSGGFNGSVYVFNNYSNEAIWSIHNCGDMVANIAITDDGSLIACASWGPLNQATPDLYIFRKESSVPVSSLTTPGSFSYVDLAPDGSKGIVAGKATHAREMGYGGNAYLFKPVPSTYGNIGGTVNLVGANDHSFSLIEIKSLENYYAFSEESGAFNIKYIPEGTYNVTVSKQGYYSKTIENVVVTGGNTVNLDIELEPAGEAVTNLFAFQGAYTTVYLKWNAYSGAHTGYNIYRKRAEAAPFIEKIATVGANVTEFIDDTALPTIHYYYAVTAKISEDLESIFSNTALGYVNTSFITREIDIYTCDIIPNIDGVISPGEWDDAFVFDASDFLGSDGRFEPVGSVIIYMKAYNDNLYVAVENKNDTQLSAGDRTALYIDDNNNGRYEEPGNDSEGNYWINYGPAGNYSIQYRPIYSNGGVGAVVDLAPNVAASDATGYVVAEFVLPIGTNDADITPGPGNKSSAYIYVRDGAFGGQDGQWPYDNPEVFVPTGYGTLNFFTTSQVPPPPTNLRYTTHYFNSPEFVAISWNLPQINNLKMFKISIKNMNTGATDHSEVIGAQMIYEVADQTTYHVTITTVNKAGQESVPSAVLEIKTDFTGIVTPNKTNFNIYPNPANNILHITSEIVEPVNIEIYNLTGSKILHQVMTESHHSINVTNFIAGVYFIKVGNAVKKFVKY
ncbi:MAG: carboxypeptidase regulatory-like domain-containing protein [Lentimicrobiaceae bacterium]|nr:carboxypeptidase regulatory-like domain-containing protein [Lentimicrobiaceae bacterium]